MFTTGQIIYWIGIPFALFVFKILERTENEDLTDINIFGYFLLLFVFCALWPIFLIAFILFVILFEANEFLNKFADYVITKFKKIQSEKWRKRNMSDE